MDTIKDLFLHSCGIIIYAIKPIIFREIHIKNKVACAIINTYIFYKLCEITYNIRNDFYKSIIEEIIENIDVENINVNENNLEKTHFEQKLHFINEKKLHFYEDNPWKTDI
jgi:hypothetical protein